MDIHTQSALPRRTDLYYEHRNPIHALYESKEKEVLATRSALYSELRALSPRSAEVIETFCNSKLDRSLDPHLGEMLPWVVADLGLVTDHRIRDVATGWLAVYIYGLLIDERADHGERLNSTEQLASLLLLHTGLNHLHEALQGSPFHAVFSQHLAVAIEGQLCDIEGNSATEAQDRESYTIAKNSCLVCGAAAVAALSPNSGMPLVNMVEDLRLALQYLDDLGDWRIDASANNHTIILSGALGFASSRGDRVMRLSDYSEHQLLRLMIESNSLESALTTIGQSLLKQIQQSGASSDTATSRFFRELREQVGLARLAVRSAQMELPYASPARRTELVDGIDQRLRIVAQGT